MTTTILTTEKPEHKWKNPLFYYTFIVFFSQVVQLRFRLGPVAINLQRILLLGYLFYALYLVLFKDKLVPWLRGLHKTAKVFLGVMIFWMLYGMISLAWTKAPVDGIRELFLLFFGIGIIVTMLVLVRTKNDIKILLSAMRWVTGIMMALMLFEWLTGIHLSTSRYNDAEIVMASYMELPAFMPTGVSYNENNQSFLMLLLTAFPLADSLLNIKSFLKERRIFPAVGSFLWILLHMVFISSANSVITIFSFYGVCIIGALFVFSVSSVLYSLALIGTYMITHSVFYNLIVRSRPILSPLVVAVAVFLGGQVLHFENRLPYIVQSDAYLNSTVPPTGKTIYDVRPNEGFSIKEVMAENSNSMSIRLSLIKEELRQTIETYGLGVGPNGFKDHVQDIEGTRNVRSPHCWPLEIIAQYGIFVFIGYAGAYLYLFFSLIKKKNIKLLPGGFGVILMLIVFVPGSMAPSAMVDYLFQWFFIAFAFAVGNIYLMPDKKEENAPFVELDHA